MGKFKISTQEALSELAKKDNTFTTLFGHGSLSVEIYRPIDIDKQQPHDRDEIYVIISGTGTFLHGTEKVNFEPGDFLFVKAGVEHRFVGFTPDFSTWVFFYGPKGGEAN